MGCGGTGSDCATDEDSGAPADQAANEHAAGRAAAGFEVIATIAGLSFELTFLIDVGAANVGIAQSGVQEVALAGGKNHGLGKNPDGGPARNAAGFSHPGHAAFDSRAYGNYCCSVDYDRLRNLSLERVADSVAEGCERRVEPDHQGRPGGHG